MSQQPITNNKQNRKFFSISLFLLRARFDKILRRPQKASQITPPNDFP